MNPEHWLQSTVTCVVSARKVIQRLIYLSPTMDIIVTISMHRHVSTYRGVTLQNDHHWQISVGLHKFYDEVPPYLMKSRTSYRAHEINLTFMKSPVRLLRSRPNQIADPGPKSGPARKSESRGPENGVSRWRRPNSDIYSQNHHFGLVYDMIYQFLGMEAKNYKFGIFCQQCHPSVAWGDADIRPRNASRIHTCHLFTS